MNFANKKRLILGSSQKKKKPKSNPTQNVITKIIKYFIIIDFQHLTITFLFLIGIPSFLFFSYFYFLLLLTPSYLPGFSLKLPSVTHLGREVVKQQADFCGVVGGQLTYCMGIFPPQRPGILKNEINGFVFFPESVLSFSFPMIPSWYLPGIMGIKLK